MDRGHFNCRDYYITPHPAPTTLTSTSSPPPTKDRHYHYQPIFHRHESFQELEQRSRSPASSKPKFALLKLPLELRQEILSYLLPRTRELAESNPLTKHAREFPAVKRREGKGMIVPPAPTKIEPPLSPSPSPSPSPSSLASHRKMMAGQNISNVVWQRGNTALFSVCRQLHAECADLVYGSNTFLLFLTYAGIKWRYRWLLPSGLAPTRNYDWLEVVPERYRRLVRRVVVHIDHVDSYTGMIKFNVSGRGLVHGLRRQVQRLVNALKPAEAATGEVSEGKEDDWVVVPDQKAERRLTKLSIRVSNSSAVSEALNRQSGLGEIKVNDDIEIMLEPFKQLYGVREAFVSGAVTDDFARGLEARLMSNNKPAIEDGMDVVEDDGGLNGHLKGLCVYGNDI